MEKKDLDRQVCKNCWLSEPAEGHLCCIAKDTYIEVSPEQECDEADFYGNLMFERKRNKR